MTKPLTASFIITVGALVACGPATPEYSVNPPPPPEPVEPIDEETPPPEPTPPEPTDETGNTPPHAGPGDKIVRKDDGTCWVYPDVDCPPSPATCNPPPPQQVACPTEE